MSKKDKNIENENKVKLEKPKKKKMSANDKRKITMKIAGIIMALVMVIGMLITIIAPLIYK